LVRTGDFPVGIDPNKILDCLQKPEVKTRIAALTEKNTGMQCIIGVDRVDYIKGIPKKLDAFDLFLEEHPEMVGKVKLVQVAIPSREDVHEYRTLATRIHQRVDMINTKYGTVHLVTNLLLPLPANFGFTQQAHLPTGPSSSCINRFPSKNSSPFTPRLTFASLLRSATG
jgi:trehalose-6-phosphate synthase